MINLSTFGSEIANLSQEDFNRMIRIVRSEQQVRRHVELTRAKASLYVGARVRSTGSDHRLLGKTLIVDKICPKNVKAHVEGQPNLRWSITASLLELVD